MLSLYHHLVIEWSVRLWPTEVGYTDSHATTKKSIEVDKIVLFFFVFYYRATSHLTLKKDAGFHCIENKEKYMYEYVHRAFFPSSWINLVEEKSQTELGRRKIHPPKIKKHLKKRNRQILSNDWKKKQL